MFVSIIPECLCPLSISNVFLSDNEFSEELSKIKEEVMKVHANDLASFEKLKVVQQDANALFCKTSENRKIIISNIQTTYNSYSTTQFQKELKKRITKILPLEDLHHIVENSSVLENKITDFIKNIVMDADDVNKVRQLFNKLSNVNSYNTIAISCSAGLSFSDTLKIGLLGPIGILSVIRDRKRQERFEEILGQTQKFIEEAFMKTTVRNYLTEIIEDKLNNFRIYNNKTTELNNRFLNALHDVNGLTKKNIDSEKKINLAEELFCSLVNNLKTKLIDDYGNLSSDFMSLIKEYNL